MTLRTLLCVNDGTEAATAALRAAFALAKTHGARARVLHVRLDPKQAQLLAGDGMVATNVEGVVDSVEQEGQRRQRRARELFDAEAECTGIPVVGESDPRPDGAFASLEIERGREHEAIARWGMLTDLIVVPPHSATEDAPATATLESAIMETGRPVLVAAEPVPEPFGRSVAVAWRATVPGVHALTEAVPILRRADAVSVLTVDEGHDGPGADAAAGYLGEHGVEATARTVSPRGRDVGATVLAETEAVGADLLVMGAYAQSRLRQLIFGGVTSTVLGHARVPLLLAH